MSLWGYDKDLTKEFEEKYKIRIKCINKGGLKLYQFLISDVEFETEDILFTKTEQGYYEPYIYDYKKNKDGKMTGSIIAEGSCLYYWIKVVRRLFSQVNKQTRKRENGSLYILQYILSIKILLNVLDGTGRTIQLLGTRQFGKTAFTVALDSFITIYVPRFVKINNAKFWTIISSYSQISVDELFSKFKTNIKDVAEMYQADFPNDKLITGIEAKKYPPYNNLKDTEEKVEYGILIGDRVEPWSVALAIPAGTVRDGVSCNFLHLDEAQYVDPISFGSIESFGASSNPVTLLTGIESQSSNTVQYVNKQYGKELVDRFKIPITLAYWTMKLTHPSRATDALNFFINKKAKPLGANSTEVLTHYMMVGDVLDGKFLTPEYAEKNKMFMTDIYEKVDEKASYRVMGVDFASTSDRTVAVITDVYEDRNYNEYEYEVRNIHVLNPNMERLAQKDIARTLARLCLTSRVGIVLCDVTGVQQPYASALIDAIEKLNINTLVVGFSFSGKDNKTRMMSYLESCLVGQQAKLPKIEYKSEHLGFKLLYEELMVLKKEKSKGKEKNILYYASYPDHDDCPMALGLSVFGLKHLEFLISKGRMIEIENRSYYPRKNKFKLLSEQENKPIILNKSYVSGLF